MIGGKNGFHECFNRINYWHERLMQFRKTKQGRAIYAYAQPYRDPNVSHHNIPMWQKDMAYWCNKRMIFASCEFKDFQPRKGFTCSKYFEDETLLE